MKPSTTQHPLRARRLACRLAASSLVFLLASAQAQTPLEGPLVRPTSEHWDSGSGFAFAKKKEQKTRKALSGIACSRNAAQERICLMAFDEGWQLRFAALGRNELTIDPVGVKLKGPEDEELDAEGAATDGTHFYVTGSHSAKRKGCVRNAHSRHVIRFRLDPATGRAMRSPAGDPQGSVVDYVDSGRLWSIMQSRAELRNYVRDGDYCGVDIEGLAFSKGRLYFGFRRPASVLAVDAEAFFQGGDPRDSVTRLELGAGRGIRDMLAVDNGFMLLTGPDDDPKNKKVNWRIAWWDGKSVAVKTLAQLDLSAVKPRTLQQGKPRECTDEDERKPEAMAVLDETTQAYQLLVLSDGMCDGGAMTFNVAR